MGKTITAMKGTVDAQEKTIKAQSEKMASMETLLKTMETVLKSTDEQNMLARLQAHKEFVEHEKAADAKRLTDKFEQEKQAMLQAATTGAEKIVDKYVEPLLGAFTSFARNTLPYVPKNRRQEFIEALNLPEGEGGLNIFRTTLQAIASAAPDLSAPTLSDFAPFPGMTLSEFAKATLTPPPLGKTLGPWEGGLPTP